MLVHVLFLFQTCHTSAVDNVHYRHAWYPCRWVESRVDYWLRVRFMDPVVATSVIVHLGADGFYSNSGPKRVSITLIGPDGVRHTQPAKDVAVSCRYVNHGNIDVVIKRLYSLCISNWSFFINFYIRCRYHFVATVSSCPVFCFVISFFIV